MREVLFQLGAYEDRGTVLRLYLMNVRVKFEGMEVRVTSNLGRMRSRSII